MTAKQRHYSATLEECYAELIIPPVFGCQTRGRAIYIGTLENRTLMKKLKRNSMRQVYLRAPFQQLVGTTRHWPLANHREAQSRAICRYGGPLAIFTGGPRRPSLLSNTTCTYIWFKRRRCTYFWFFHCYIRCCYCIRCCCCCCCLLQQTASSM